jgi:POT family proton-dependent oligopeptide transporter
MPGLSFRNFPKVFFSTCSVEMMERFSYYGFKAILTFYISYSVFLGGLGIDKSLAASIVAIYGSLISTFSIFGGWIGDRVLSNYRNIQLGSLFIIVGHIGLAFLSGFQGLITGLFFILIGTGLLKPATAVIVGDIYQDKSNVSDSAYSLYYLGINIGAFLASMIVGYVGMNTGVHGFHYGFAISAIAMVLGLIIYSSVNKDKYPPKSIMITDKLKFDEIKKLSVQVIGGLCVGFLILWVMHYFNILNIGNLTLLISVAIILIPIYYFYTILSSDKIISAEKSNIWYYIPLFIGAMLFWSIQEQVQMTLVIFAEHFVNMMGMPIPWLNSVNPMGIILFTPVFIWLWLKLGNKQPSSGRKFFIGLVIAGLSFIILALPLLFQSTNISVLWVIVSILFCVCGELFISPTGLSTTYKMAPSLFSARLMSIWMLSNAAGQAFNSQCVKFFIGNELQYFLILGLLSLAFSLVLLKLMPNIEKRLQ